MRRNGLNKDGIYNHFESKEKLAVRKLRLCYRPGRPRMSLAIENATNALDKLLAIISVIGNLGEDQTTSRGMSPALTRRESDDANPVLRERARTGDDRWRNRIPRLPGKDVNTGEINSSVDGRCP